MRIWTLMWWPLLLSAVALGIAVAHAATPPGAGDRSPTVATASGTLRGFFRDGESNLRDRPTTEANLLGQPEKGTRFDVMATSGSWYRVRLEDGRVGWVHGKNLRLTDKSLDPAWEAEANGHRVGAAIDLDGDGQPEQITLVPHHVDPKSGDAVFHLRVCRGGADANAEPIWEDSAREIPFVIADHGVEDLELVADFDADGAIEIVSHAPQSDVSPTRFRVLRWQNGRFELTRTGYLVGDAQPPSRFRWTPVPPADSVLPWILYFVSSTGPGTLLVQTAAESPDAAPAPQARVRAVADGFIVEALIPTAP